MLSAILVKDSKPTGVTESTAVLVDCRPAIRMVGSNAPRTSISLPKMSAMELRYSSWVSRRMLATWELAAIAGAALRLTAPRTVKERTETANFCMRDFRVFLVMRPAQTVQQRD